MTTVRELIFDALIEIGVCDPTMALDANMGEHALRVLNRMLESWSNDDLMVYTENRDVYALTAGLQEYTLGGSSNFNAARPINITRASILLTATTPNVEVPIQILLTQQWQNVSVKVVNGGFPTSVYVTGDFPLQKLIFWPVPQISCSAVIYSWGQLLAFSDITDTVSFPKGYSEAIVSNLAIRLCPTYGKQPSAATAGVARSSVDRIKCINNEPIYVGCDSPSRRSSGYSKAIQSFGYIVD